MLAYEHTRTESIVGRLTTIATTVTTLFIFIGVITGASLGAAFGATVAGRAAIISILGAIIGFFIGKIFSGLVVVFIEWCAQVLIAQGEIIESQKNRNKNVQ
jgi:Na+-driven multidrug efflux pump